MCQRPNASRTESLAFEDGPRQSPRETLHVRSLVDDLVSTVSSAISPDDFGGTLPCFVSVRPKSAPLLEAFVIDFVETVSAHGFVRLLEWRRES